MNFDEWLFRLKNIFGKEILSCSNDDEYACEFSGRHKIIAKQDELLEDYPFYCYFTYLKGEFARIYVNHQDFIEIIWESNLEKIEKLYFFSQSELKSKEEFCEGSNKHEEVSDWVIDHFVAKSKNRLEIITNY